MQVRSKVKLMWSTPDAENMIVDMARVSAPSNQGNYDTGPRLLKYLIKNNHWSPLEMASMCVEIETPRDIARQILRHRSFSFQEFSQRYAEVEQGDLMYREPRMQDTKNRQNSLVCTDKLLEEEWEAWQWEVQNITQGAYEWALKNGIAKEVARVVLPEGLTMSRMYMTGTLRSWIHYCSIRCDVATQKEHREVADQIKVQLLQVLPSIREVLEETIQPT